MSFTLSFANTGVNNPSFIFSFSRGPNARSGRSACGAQRPAPLRDLCLFVPNAGPNAAASVTLQNGVDDARGMIAVVERCERRRLRLVCATAARNEAVY